MAGELSRPARCANGHAPWGIYLTCEKNWNYSTWYGMMAPAATPAPLAAALHGATSRVLAAPTIQERLNAQGLQIHALPPAQFQRYLADELQRWKRVIDSAGIAPQ